MPKKKTGKKSKADDSHKVNLPKSVQDQADKADELIAGKKDEPAATEDVIIDNPDQDPPKEPDKPVFTPVDPEPPVEPVKKEPEPLPEDNQNWKHKYDVLQGMFNAKDGEVKALQQGMTNLQNLVDHQAKQIKSIQVAPQPQSTPVAPVQSDIIKIDLDSVAGYGDEIVQMATGFNSLVDINNQLLAKIDAGAGQVVESDPRLDRIESMVTETAQERYGRTLDKEVPKWRDVVNSPEFAGWLQNIDPMSGYQYKQMMDFAYKNLRAGQAAAIIRRFGMDTGIDTGTIATPPAPVKKVGSTNIVDQTKVDPLAEQTMPDETTAGDQGQTPEVYPTAEDVTNASVLYAQGRISIEKFNEISDRFQKGMIAAKKKKGLA